MANFSWMKWINEVCQFGRQPLRRSRRRKMLAIEGLEDRTLLTANLPVANDDAYQVAGDTTLNGSTVLANDTDADGDTIDQAVFASGVSHGTLTLSGNGTFAYTPATGFTGIDSFTYYARDSVDNENSASPARVTITVGTTNEGPVADPLVINVATDTAFVGGLSGTDPEGDSLTFAAGSTSASHGTVSIGSDGSFTYTPGPGYNGPDTFSFNVDDGTTTSADALVRVNVGPGSNHAPVPTSISINATQDTVFAGSVSAVDPDNDPLTYNQGSTVAAHGTVSIALNGNFTYTPNVGYVGADSFSFTASDGVFSSTTDGLVSIQVASTGNATPVANAISINVGFNTTFGGGLSGSDADGDSLTYAAGSKAAAHGTVTINTNGTFTYSPTTGYSGSDSFSFHVNDGTVNSADALVSVTVAAAPNHAPVATATSINVTFNTKFNGTLSGTDADGDSLTFLAGNTAAAHGTVVINSNGTFSYTPATGYSGSDSFTFKVNDGTVNSANATVSVTVAAGVNHAPVATPQSINVVFNTQYSGTLAGTDSDGNSLTFLAGNTAAAHGTVVINSNGTFTYKPTTGYSGSDSFSFKVNDGTVNSANATVSVTVATAVNHAPVATPQSINVTFNTQYSGTLTGTDADSNTLTFSAGSTAAAHGTVVINSNGTFTYTPTTGYSGSDSFSFKVNDGTVNSADATVSVTVAAHVNSAPVATAVTINAILNTTYSGQLAGTDADGDSLAFSQGSTLAAHGIVQITTAGAFTYTPNTGYTGNDAFSFKVNDGTVNSADATVTVHVDSTNTAPVATPQSIKAILNTTYSGQLAGTDVNGDTLTFSQGSTLAAHGIVQITTSGAFTYTPNTGYTGSDSFSFKVNDGTVNSADATVSVQVALPNRAPVATPANISVTFNTQYSGTLSGTDADGDTLTFAAGTTAAAHGTVVINSDGTFTYTPNTGYSGNDAFSFIVNDGTVNSANATVAVQVAARVNHAPVATATTIQVVFNTTFIGTLTGTDADGDSLTFAAGSTSAAHGTVGISPSGTFTYTPNAGYSGSDSFSFKVNDGIADSANATVTVQVAPANRAPVANATSFSVVANTSYSGTLTGFDADGNTLTFAAGSTSALHGTVLINTNGSFTYTPTAGYIGSDSFSFKVNDGFVYSADALVSVQVTAPVNHAPVATSVTIGVALNTQYVGTLSGTDADGDTLTFAAGSTAASHGTVQIASNGTFTYTPNTGYLGSDAFSFKVNDGTVNSADGLISIQVSTGVNHPPVATATSIHTVLNTTYSGILTGTDADGNSLTFAAGSTAAAHGIVVINPAGNFTYTPNTGYVGTDSFSFKVNDGTVNSADATVAVQVTASNTPPVATATSIHVVFSTPYSGTLTGTDVDGDPLTFSLGSTFAAHGTVQITSIGTFTYTPATNYIGSDSFSFKVNDGTVNSADALVSVQVAGPVNHAPIANPANISVVLNTLYSGTLTGSDADGNVLTFTAGSTSAAHGTVVINTNGGFTYTPNTGYTGSDSFSFKVNDGTTNSADATISVQVAPANTAPVATPASINVVLNTQYFGALNGTDADGDTLTFLAGNISAAHGTVIIHSNGTFTYTPATGYTGSDAFSFRVNDGTVDSANATVAVHVTAVANRAPVAVAANINVFFNTQYSGTLTGTDVDGNTLTFAPGSTSATHGTVVIHTNGTFTYTPNTGYTGGDSFSFKVNDGTVDSSPATISIQVVDAINTIPVANPATITTTVGTALTGTLTGSDADGDPLTFLIGTTTPAHGTIALDTNGHYVYTPNAGYVGNDFFTFKVNDGTASSSSAAVIVRVQAAASAAPIVSTGTGSVVSNVAFDGSVSALSVDAEGDPLTFAIVTQPTHGTLILSPDGTFVYTPATNYVGPDSFEFKANDGSHDSNVGTFNLTVAEASTGFDVALSDDPGIIATQVQNVTPLDTTADLVNVDPAVTFANAVLTTSITSGAGRGDRFVVTSGGTVEIRGKHVRINGVEVARLSGGGSGQALQITFSSSASADSVQAVMQRIGLQTTKRSASTSRVVRFTVNADGFSKSDTIVANKA